MFKGFNSLNLFALQQPKVDSNRGNSAGGVVPQETICAFGDDASTGLDYISGDKDILVCMCILCFGVQCNIPVLCICYQVMFKGFNSLNLFALQQPKTDLKYGNTAYGVVPQETIHTSGDDASTGLHRISDDHALPMVCMCVLCVGLQSHL